MDVRFAVAKIRKAIAAAIAVAVVTAAGRFVHVDVAAVEVVVDALLVSGLVWAVPNAKDWH